MKKILTLIISVILVFSLVGCGADPVTEPETKNETKTEEITLNLSFGSKTGTYEGEFVNGVPNGQGKFTSQNAEGTTWVYEGNFVDGHFSGEGQTTWYDDDGNSIKTEVGTYENDTIVPMSGDEIKTLYTDTEKFIGHYVELTGQIFTTPETYDGYVMFQMYTDVENSEGNTWVAVYDDFDGKSGDYIKITGPVLLVSEGTNYFGATLEVPVVQAAEWEIVDFSAVATPASKVIEVNQTQTQNGYSITIQRIEFTKNETRVYMEINNNGSDKFYCYQSDIIISQNKKQYEYQINWNVDYPEIQSSLLSGNASEGIVVFPPISADDPFTITIDADSGNYKEKFSVYQFSID